MSSKPEIVVEYIKENIRKGNWTSGCKIPTETEISKTLNIGRNSVRDAISKLVYDGLIYKVQGSGTYVADNVSSNSKKYIIISIIEEVLFNITGYTYRTLIDFLKKFILSHGYVPYVHLKENDINIDVSNVAGIINILSHDYSYDEFTKNQIPIVSALCSDNTMYPSTTINYFELAENIASLVRKYNFKKYLVVGLNIEISDCQISETLMQYYITRYIANVNNGDTLYVPWNYDFKDAPKLFKEKIQNLNYIPDAIVFVDDVIFDSVSSTFIELESIISQTKIITHSNYERNFKINIPICKVEISLEEIAKEAMQTLIKLVNNEYMTYHNRSISPKIINEEILKGN